MQNQHKEYSVTVSSERNFANSLCNSIHTYWRERGYNIKVWIGSTEYREKSEQEYIRKNIHCFPIFPIRSNIGPGGCPPEWS